MLSAFWSLLGTEKPPTQVLDVQSDLYLQRPVHDRQDGLILYLPSRNNLRDNEKFEIVLHRPCTESMKHAYSLFRSENVDIAEEKFHSYCDKIPVLLEITRELNNANGLQKLCDALNAHPTWNVAHVAAYLSLTDAFNHAAVNRFLNSSDPHTGMSPLQVAITTNNVKIVLRLIAAKCSLEHLDSQDNTVFHYAAGSVKDIILALGQTSTTCLNKRNTSGHTPLHLACIHDKPDCVKALLMVGADVNITASRATNGQVNAPGYVGEILTDHSNKLFVEDMKLGGTPLHWSVSREVVVALLSMNCDINALNFDGRTALHVMVLRNRLDCIVALLSHGAEINIGDSDGNTPLHLAVLQHGNENNVAIVQAFVVFGADLEHKNNNGCTPRHLVLQDDASKTKSNAAPTNSDADKILYILHAVGANRCDKIMEGCSDGCKYDGDYIGFAPPVILGPQNFSCLEKLLDEEGEKRAPPLKTKGGRLLSLDGGGIRGLILIEVLLELEEVLQKPTIHSFDWVAGTSTGGILALGLACGRTMRECLCLYFRMKDMAFVGIRPYSSEPLETMLKECLGTETVMADIRHPKVMITGLLADRKPVDLHLFRNYESPARILNIKSDSRFPDPPDPDKQLVWHAARATGAAPSYFSAFGRFLDGGLMANNPTMDALTEIYEYNCALRAKGREAECQPVTLVVSVGTGHPPVVQLKSVDIFRPESLWDTAKVAMGINNIGTLLVDQATQSIGRVVDRARSWCSMIGVPYFRFNPLLSEDIIMDEKNDVKLVNMLWETKAYARGKREAMLQLAEILSRE